MPFPTTVIYCTYLLLFFSLSSFSDLQIVSCFIDCTVLEAPEVNVFLCFFFSVFFSPVVDFSIILDQFLGYPFSFRLLLIIFLRQSFVHGMSRAFRYLCACLGIIVSGIATAVRFRSLFSRRAKLSRLRYHSSIIHSTVFHSKKSIFKFIYLKK